MQKTVKQYAYKEGEVVERLNLNEFGRITAPCKDCKDRHIGCHSDCELYKEFQRRNEELNKRKRFENGLHSYEMRKRLAIEKKYKK